MVTPSQSSSFLLGTSNCGKTTKKILNDISDGRRFSLFFSLISYLYILSNY